MTLTTDRQIAKDQLRRADAQGAGQQIKRTAAAPAAWVQDKVRSGADRLRSRTRDLAEHTQHQVRSGQDQALKLVRERPAASAAVVVGLTVLAGLLFANRARLMHGAADLRRSASRRSRLRHRA